MIFFLNYGDFRYDAGELLVVVGGGGRRKWFSTVIGGDGWSEKEEDSGGSLKKTNKTNGWWKIKMRYVNEWLGLGLSSHTSRGFSFEQDPVYKNVCVYNCIYM